MDVRDYLAAGAAEADEAIQAYLAGGVEEADTLQDNRICAGSKTTYKSKITMLSNWLNSFLLTITIK